MATMVARMLDLADQLANQGRRSSAVRRRAVSTAYYAVFHAIAKVCADTLLQQRESSASVRYSDEYERVYRALEHGILKNAFAQNGSPLHDRESLRRIGELIIPLRSARFRADYLPPRTNIFTFRQGQGLVAQARTAVSELEALSEDDRRCLSAWLLFKNPPS